MERAKAALGSSVRYATSAYEACRGAHALLVLTDWQEFAELDLTEVHKALRHPIVIDGRNMFPVNACGLLASSITA